MSYERITSVSGHPGTLIPFFGSLLILWVESESEKLYRQRVYRCALRRYVLHECVICEVCTAVIKSLFFMFVELLKIFFADQEFKCKFIFFDFLVMGQK